MYSLLHCNVYAEIERGEPYIWNNIVFVIILKGSLSQIRLVLVIRRLFHKYMHIYVIYIESVITVWFYYNEYAQIGRGEPYICSEIVFLIIFIAINHTC